MSDAANITDFSKPIFLHHTMQKFWEIRLDPSHKAIVRCGKLNPDGQEDPVGIQQIEKSNHNREEAEQYAKKHIAMKFQKGYQTLEKHNNNSTNNTSHHLGLPGNNGYHDHDFHSPSMLSPKSEEKRSSHKRSADESLERDDLKLTKKTNGTMSNREPIEDDSLNDIMKNIEEQEKFEEKQKQLGDYVQKGYRIENLTDPEKPRLEKKAQELDLICDFEGTKIVVTGFSKVIDQYVTFLKQFINEKKKSEEDTKQDIPITSKLVKFSAEIEQKGLDLGIICEVHETSVIAIGKPSKIAEFKKFLVEKEKQDPSSDPPVAPKSVVEDNTTRKELPLSATMKRNMGEIEKKGDQLGLYSQFTEDKLIVLGSHEGITDFIAYLFELEASPAKETVQKDDPGEFVQKEIKITKAINEVLAEIKKKAESLDLILDIDSDQFLIAGYEKKITELKNYIDEKEKEQASKPSSGTTENKSMVQKSGDYVQKEISISTFHRGCQDKVEAKAKELDLICDFGYDVVLVTGYQGNIGMFIAYLYEAESEAKKALYPKHWDFHEVNAFSMADIPPGSEEHNEVVKLFRQTMQGHQILKLERIQNKYLMDHYITNIQKRRELRPNEPLNRMLLFHGTRNTKPDTIYKNFDVGFDLQYANSGMYGKGLYFAVGANYSHSGFVYRTQRGTFQLLIADVFVGKSKNSGGGNYIKAPEGYDSISANGGFYIIYNNFHSYPLYLLEYK